MDQLDALVLGFCQRLILRPGKLGAALLGDAFALFRQRGSNEFRQRFPFRRADRIRDNDRRQRLVQRSRLQKPDQVIGDRTLVSEHRTIERAARHRFVDFRRRHPDRHGLDAAHHQVERAARGPDFQPFDVSQAADGLSRRQQDLISRQRKRDQGTDTVRFELVLGEKIAVPRQRPIGRRTQASVAETAGQFGRRGQRHLVGGIGRHDVSDINHPGLRQPEQVFRLAELLGREVGNDDFPVGAFFDRLDERLGDGFMDDVADRQTVGEPQCYRRFLRARGAGSGRCNEEQSGQDRFHVVLPLREPHRPVLFQFPICDGSQRIMLGNATRIAITIRCAMKCGKVP